MNRLKYEPCCKPWRKVSKVAYQMEFALSYTCEEVESIVEAVKKLADAEEQSEHVVVLESSESTESVNPEPFETNMSSAVPGGNLALENLVDEFGEGCGLDSSADLTSYAGELSQGARFFCVQYKLSQAGKKPSAHLLILHPNGSYFCSCGYPARNGLVYRSFFG